MRIASIVINAAIFLTTCVLLVHGVRKSGWKLFRYFTVLSNALCALSALVMALCQIGGDVPTAALLFKYVGTASIAVTMATALLFLGPTQGYREMLSGPNLYEHLIIPVLAIGSYCFLEKAPMPLWTVLLGMLPVALYGAVYLYKVIFAPEGSRWEDFYGFNRGGRWPVAFAAMIVATLLICVGLWLL